MVLYIKDDGVTHINIYSKAKTDLGRYLSNFTQCGLLTEDGSFESIEGYWYWLSSKNDKLRSLHGWEAKHYGRSVGGKDWIDDADFKRKICLAIEYKIKTMPFELWTQFYSSDAPFKHYYVYNDKIVEPKEGKWIIDHITQVRGNNEVNG